MSAIAGKTMSADGLGYWSVDLPAVDGAQIDLSLYIRANEIKPVNENGGLFVVAEFCDETANTGLNSKTALSANKILNDYWANLVSIRTTC